MHCLSFLIWGDPKGDFVMRVAHQQTEAGNDPSVVGKAEIRGLFLIAQPPSHDAQNRLNSGILRHNLDFFRKHPKSKQVFGLRVLIPGNY
jgi:hypothetical protein